MHSMIPAEIFSAYAHLGKPLQVAPVDMGLINKTYVITTAENKYILQEISKIFDTTIIDDSFAVSNYLSPLGFTTPAIYTTGDDKLFIVYADRVFRALKYINGHSYNTVQSLDMASSAGRIVGEFHQKLMDFSYDYRSKRRHGGDYSFHCDNLQKALNSHQQHDYFVQVKPLAEAMLASMSNLTSGLVTTPRHVHGDPKISNIIFDEQDQAICLIDFDTLGKTGWSLEMGDALRSWCNPNKEDVLSGFVDMAIAEHALKGYGSVMHGYFTAKEVDELQTHVQAITLCLAIRYLTDVLNESYWLYDKSRFSRAADHNLIRAQSMYNLYREFHNKAADLYGMMKDYLL